MRSFQSHNLLELISKSDILYKNVYYEDVSGTTTNDSVRVFINKVGAHDFPTFVYKVITGSDDDVCCTEDKMQPELIQFWRMKHSKSFL